MYYDATTQRRSIDHWNPTVASSPRSVHYQPPSPYSRPGSAPGPVRPTRAEATRESTIQQDNIKLLKAIALSKSVYDTQGLERRYAQESMLLDRISTFRGPADARYVPPARAASASAGGSRNMSPYLAASRPGTARSGTAGARQSAQLVPRPATAAARLNGPTAKDIVQGFIGNLTVAPVLNAPTYTQRLYRTGTYSASPSVPAGGGRPLHELSVVSEGSGASNASAGELAAQAARRVTGLGAEDGGGAEDEEPVDARYDPGLLNTPDVTL